MIVSMICDGSGVGYKKSLMLVCKNLHDQATNFNNFNFPKNAKDNYQHYKKKKETRWTKNRENGTKGTKYSYLEQFSEVSLLERGKVATFFWQLEPHT